MSATLPDLTRNLLAPLTPWLDDPDVTEIMIGPDVDALGLRHLPVRIERAGVTSDVPVTLDETLVTRTIQLIASDCGLLVSEDAPLLDATLPDGSRVSASLPPVSAAGPMLTIRRFGRRFTLAELCADGMMTPAQATWLERQVRAQQTLLISGGTNTGKTTLLNALAALIPPDERIAILEDTTEVHVPLPHRFPLVTRPAHDGVPAITMTDLLRHTLRHRPDRIIVGEVRLTEAWDLLQALNTGHPGSLTTIHANTAAAALDRLAMLVLTAHHGVPYEVVNQTIAHAIAGIVQLTRRRDDPERADSPRRRVVADLCVIDAYARADDTWHFTHVGDPTPARERSAPC